MSEKDRKFLAYFDTEGFECLRDITKDEHEQTIAKLKGETAPDRIGLHQMILRARYNPQRFPEIWVFTSSVGETTLQDLAQNEPQMLADLIRSHGVKVYGDKQQKRVIE